MPVNWDAQQQWRLPTGIPANWDALGSAWLRDAWRSGCLWGSVPATRSSRCFAGSGCGVTAGIRMSSGTERDQSRLNWAEWDFSSATNPMSHSSKKPLNRNMEYYGKNNTRVFLSGTWKSAKPLEKRSPPCSSSGSPQSAGGGDPSQPRAAQPRCGTPPSLGHTTLFYPISHSDGRRSEQKLLCRSSQPPEIPWRGIPRVSPSQGLKKRKEKFLWGYFSAFLG